MDAGRPKAGGTNPRAHPTHWQGGERERPWQRPGTYKGRGEARGRLARRFRPRVPSDLCWQLFAPGAARGSSEARAPRKRTHLGRAWGVSGGRDQPQLSPQVAIL